MAAYSAAKVEASEKALDLPEAVIEITRRLEREGHETWAVGGAVRDALLGEKRTDWDLATAARPETVRKLFRPSYPIGIEFGTVGVRGHDGLVYEVTTFRRDIATDGRHAVVEYSDDIADDLARRDFTINAIAYHPIRHTYFDPHAGRHDLRSRLLKCVGDPATRFSEDYLRVLRGLRFAGRYGLEIEARTWRALRGAVGGLPRLSGERVREELLKTLSAPGARSGLSLYRTSGALAALVPELGRLPDAEWDSRLAAIDRLSSALYRLVVLLAPVGPELASVMRRLRFSNSEIRRVSALVTGLQTQLPSAESVVAIRRWLKAVEPEHSAALLQLHASLLPENCSAELRDELAERARRIREVQSRGDPVRVTDLAIDGDDIRALGVRPGPLIGRLLEVCLEAVIEDPAANRRETLLALVEKRREAADVEPENED